MNARKILAKAYLWLLILVLYAPIAFIVIFSFTEAKSLGNWTGFSTQLYGNLFSGSMQNASGLQSAVINTLLIALVASIFATLLGTVAAIGIHHLSGRKKRTMTFLNNIPMINPDIITGVSLFLLFVFLGISQGYLTVILAHITFCTPYVVLNVMPKLKQLNPNIYEAALDLGATPAQALRKVLVPALRPLGHERHYLRPEREAGKQEKHGHEADPPSSIASRLHHATIFDMVRTLQPSSYLYSIWSINCLHRKMPRPPICRSSAERVMSGSALSSGLKGTPASRSTMVSITPAGSSSVPTSIQPMPPS